MSDPALHDRRFVWPPAGSKPTDGSPAIRASADPSDDASGAAAPRVGAIARLVRWWRDVEDAWLDPTALPLDIRAEQAGWSCDPVDVYCDRCGHTIGPHESSEFGCSGCARTRPPWDRFVRLGEYQPPLADWICEVKFERFRTLGLELGRALARQVRASCGGIALSRANAVVVPVPTTLRRRVERGIDHAGVIAHAVARELDLPMVRALVREHRPSQRAVAASARQANVSGSVRLARLPVRASMFGLRTGREAVAGKTIVLVDDVLTSGSTLRAAARAVHEAESEQNGRLKIVAAVLAVTSDPARRPVVHGPATADERASAAEFP